MLGLGLVLALGSLSVGCGASNKGVETGYTVDKTPSNEESQNLIPINIGYPSAGGGWSAGALGVAEVEGYLDDYLNPLGYKANLQGFTGAAPAIHEALVAKDLDIASYASMAGISAKANGIDTTLIGIQGNSPIWEMVTLETSQMTDITQLKGKSIAYVRGTATHEYLIKVLEEAHLTTSDVELVNMTTPEGISALVTGSVDAAVVSIGQELSIENSVIIHDERSGGSERYYSPSIMTVRTDFLKDHKEAVVAFLEALLKAKDTIVGNPEAYYEFYAEKTGYSLEFVKTSIGADDLNETIPLSKSVEYLAKLESVQQFLMDNELIPSQVDFQTWIDDSYLQEAVNEYKK